MEDQAKFEGYAIVEIMGHQTMAGYVTTQAFGSVIMFKVTQDAAPAEEKTLDEARYIGGRWYEAGTKIRAERREASSLIGAASVYRMTPCTREEAWRKIPVIFTVVDEARPALPEPQLGLFDAESEKHTDDEIEADENRADDEAPRW